MKKTTNYQLNQWEKDDRILMEDFNADNLKIEQALTAEAAAREALEAVIYAGDLCKIHTFTYEGTDTGAPSNPLTLTFPKPPMVILIGDLTDSDHSIFIRGDSGDSSSSKTWDGNTFTCSGKLPSAQMTVAGHTYRVVALMMDQA